jgi:glycerol-3-phosphate O-acyltransferase
LRSWSEAHPGALELPKAERLAAIETLARDVMNRIAAIMPVTAVPLEAAALLSFDRPRINSNELAARVAAYCAHLEKSGARLPPLEHGPRDILERAGRILTQRGLVHQEGDWTILLPASQPLLKFYANSIAHLLPPSTTG